jgi:diacylglycerol kinase (ATP)
MKPGKSGLARLIDATGYSFKGLKAAFVHEAAFRQELLLVAVLGTASFWLAANIFEWLVLVVPLFILIIVELLNSAIENTVDRIGDELHELSGRAKDMGSAAVMLSLGLVAVCWGAKTMVCIWISLLVLGGCASNPQAKPLDNTLTQYEQFIRWSQWDGAAGFLAPEYLIEHPVTRLDMDRLRLFRVTQYVARAGVPFDGGLGYRQTVEIRLFNRNRALERSVMDEQEWRYNEEAQRWFLHSGLPDVTKAR